MTRPQSEHPTALELEILKVLWEEAPLPVREVQGRLAEQAGRKLTYSSVITMLNIMVRKGYLRRQKQGKAFFYSPKVDKQQISGGLLGDLMARLFDDEPSAMILNLLESAELDADELSEVRKLINRKSKEQQ